MSTINDGDTAFPAGDMRGYEPSFGMTLRDYFAGQALPAVIIATSAGQHQPVRMNGDTHIRDAIARDAYAMADAMFSARSQKDGE